MLEQLTTMEVDLILRYTPDREPTREELLQLELETPTQVELNEALEREAPPRKKIIINEIENEIG
jgi:hypothetical protein